VLVAVDLDDQSSSGQKKSTINGPIGHCRRKRRPSRPGFFKRCHKRISAFVIDCRMDLAKHRFAGGTERCGIASCDLPPPEIGCVVLANFDLPSRGRFKSESVVSWGSNNYRWRNWKVLYLASLEREVNRT
jgi:hypothetical protein